MLLAAGRAVVEQLTLLLKQETLRPLLVPLLIVVLSTFFLLLWRLWTFTILPTLRSDEPKELPHWFPCKLTYAPVSFLVIQCSSANSLP